MASPATRLKGPVLAVRDTPAAVAPASTALERRSSNVLFCPQMMGGQTSVIVVPGGMPVPEIASPSMKMPEEGTIDVIVLEAASRSPLPVTGGSSLICPRNSPAGVNLSTTTCSNSPVVTYTSPEDGPPELLSTAIARGSNSGCSAVSGTIELLLPASTGLEILTT